MDAHIRRLISPRSIAIIGATPQTAKLNGRPMHYLLRDRFPGKLYPVNPKYQDVLGVRCYPDIESLPEPAELAIIAVPARFVANAVASLGQRGTRTAIIYASGFSEVGEAGARLERELSETALEHGVRICGPNNLGVINAFEGVTATFSQYAQEPPLAGPIAFASQSGAFGTGISALARERGLGFGVFVNTGNQVDISVVEVLNAMLDDDRISVLTAYLEGLSNGQDIIELADRAVERGKPLVLIKVGRKGAGARAAASHTGSLAGEDKVFDDVLRQHGVLRVQNEEQLLDVAAAFSCCPPAKGRGLAIITQSGGAGAMMADRAEEVGLDVPIMQPETKQKLLKAMPDFGATGNPIDVTGQFIADPAMLRDSVRIVMEDPNVDICVIWIQLMSEHSDMLVGLFQDIKREATKPFLVCWLGAKKEARVRLQQAGVCVIDATERVVDAAAYLAEYGNIQRCAEPRPKVDAIDIASRKGNGMPRPVPSIQASEMLRRHGLSLPPCRLATTADEAAEIAGEVGFPLAVKIESPDILHKTEVGGVALNLNTSEAVKQAAEAVIGRASAKRPTASIDGVLLQQMAAPATELVLGVRRDPVFGPTIMVGLGGILVELLKDVVFAAAPVTRTDAHAMLDRLKGRALLDGFRGAPPVNRQALVDAICSLSDFALAHPELVELDLNPVFAGPAGTTAVDWLMVVDHDVA